MAIADLNIWHSLCRTVFRIVYVELVADITEEPRGRFGFVDPVEQHHVGSVDAETVKHAHRRLQSLVLALQIVVFPLHVHDDRI